MIMRVKVVTKENILKYETLYFENLSGVKMSRVVTKPDFYSCESKGAD